jgi:hypothetical protein
MYKMKGLLSLCNVKVLKKISLIWSERHFRFVTHVKITACFPRISSHKVLVFGCIKIQNIRSIMKKNDLRNLAQSLFRERHKDLPKFLNTEGMFMMLLMFWILIQPKEVSTDRVMHSLFKINMYCLWRKY